jgi:ubiquinone/menaquinone biosynthesis C-methylase UbiE
MLISDCGLLPSHKILDIGCGIGRVAIPLTAYISKEGRYEGFDIVRQGIEWCKDKISKKFPNFNFTHIDLRNELYNLETDTTSAEFTFPYEDHSFDIVIATSLFTHMLPKDTERYVQEVSRLLKVNGKLLCTFFILNEVSKIAMRNNLHFNFQHIRGNYSLMDEKVKEANIAYEENYLNSIFSKNSLKIDKLTYGYWSGSKIVGKKEFQDTFVLSSVKMNDFVVGI